jgi:predicted Rossmann fold nucleotide-binding protein DprA/Smf involved in DNA uptake
MQARDFRAILAWQSVPFLGERTLLALLDHARESRRTPADLWEQPLDDLAEIVPLHPRAVKALRSDSDAIWQRAGEVAGQLRVADVELLAIHQPDYPAVLDGDRRPVRRWPTLFTHGALHLVDEPGVLIVNSREPSHAALAVTDALADALARRDIPLLCSTGRPSYQATATAAKRHAGPTIFSLDRGIGAMFPRGVDRDPVPTARVWDETFDPELQLLLSPFGWSERWTARSGPRRDALLFDLAGAVVAVDVREGGHMERECRVASRRGRPVIAVDQGPETPDGTRALWNDGGALRVEWRGEATADRVLSTLPGAVPAAAEEPEQRRSRREWALFLLRACELLRPSERGAIPPIRCVPPAGPFARYAGNGLHGTRRGPEEWLLADLSTEEPSGAHRLRALAEQLPLGGLLGAIVPAAWLEAGELASQRAEWLKHADLRLAARLPQSPGADKRLAALVLRRGVAAADAAPVFIPDQEMMGRFHQRRYLGEILAALERRLSGENRTVDTP